MAKSKKNKGKDKNKRRSMGAGTRRATQAAITGVEYLNLPKGVKLFKEEKDKRYHMDHVPYIITDDQIKKHPEKQHIEGDIWWRRPYKLHKNIGPDRLDLVCPKSIGKKCRICDDKQKLYEDPHGDEKVAKLLRAKDRVLYSVIPKKNKDYNEEIHLWDVGYWAYGKELSKELDYNDIGCPADLEGGYTVESRFSEEPIGKGNSWIKCDRIDFKPRDDFDEDILEEVPNLDDCLIILSDKEIGKIYTGIDDVSGYDNEDNDDEDEEGEDDDGNDGDDYNEEDEEESEEISADDIDVMKKKELLALIKSEDLDVKPKKHKKIKDLREAVIEAMDFDDEDEDEESEEVDLDEMDKDELLEFAEENDIDIKKKHKKMSKKKLKAYIEENMSEEDEDEDNECPHGYTFGDDNAEYDECSDCKVYDDCLEALD